MVNVYLSSCLLAKPYSPVPSFPQCPFKALFLNAKWRSSRQPFAFSILKIINILQLPAPWFINPHFLRAAVKWKLCVGETLGPGAISRLVLRLRPQIPARRNSAQRRTRKRGVRMRSDRWEAAGNTGPRGPEETVDTARRVEPDSLEAGF